MPVAAVAIGTTLLISDRKSAPADPTAGLSLRKLAGQRIVYSFAGTSVPARLLERVRRDEAGGVILFSRNIGSRRTLRRAVARLQAAAGASRSGLPLLVMIDQEGGLVKRLSGAPRHSPAALGRIESSSLARSDGTATARNLRSIGINVDLAPVLDVGRPGSFQRRSRRSYGGDPELVARLGSAFAGGLQDGGVAATLKHFPGIGFVRADEDLRAQRIPLSRSQLRGIDERPFAAAVASGAKLVMTSTAVYPAFDSNPAMLSKALSGDELRNRLGFDGVSITDDIEVPGLARFGSAPALGLRAARAGNDLLLFAQHYDVAVAALSRLTAAARAGNPTADQMRSSARRVMALRAELRR